MEENTQPTEQSAGLASAPIIPSLPELQTANDPMAPFKAAPPVITPVIPSGTPSSYNISRELQGDYQSGPRPGTKSSNLQKNGGTEAFVKAAVGYMQDDNTVKDRYKYGRTYSYGSGYKNMNFEKYYTHSKFKELGFSPYRDNETVYNENSSWWDDFNRMRGQWGKLAWSGFKSVWGDEKEAHEEMEKAMAIGTSTRGGVGGWVTNFGINSAYTVGILGEIVLEDLALGALEYASGGMATPIVGAELTKQAWSLKRLTEAWKGTYDLMKSLRSAEKAKELFTAAKAGEKLKDFANWVTPFRETREWTTHLAKGTNGVDKMGDFAKTAKTFGNFYRDVRELNLAHSEARLEGEGASSEYQDKLIDKFYAENGRMPEGEEATDIYNKAQSVKGAVTLANDFTIYLTNKLVFENILRPFNPTKAVMDAFFQGSGRALKKTAAAEFKVGAKAAYDVAEDAFKNKAFNALFKSEYVPWSRRYFLGNLSEALQENSQEVITQSALDYYERVHSDPTQAGFYSSLISVGKATKGQFSQQGLDTFLQGYLMGSLIQAGGGMLGKAREYAGKGASGLAYYATKGKYGTEFGQQSQEDLAKAQAEETENERLNSVNFILDNALIYGGEKADIASAVNAIYKAKSETDEKGDEYNSRGLNHEAQVNHFHSLARTNSMGLVTDYVNDMLSLEDSALEDAFNKQESAEKIREKLSTLSDRAKGYQAKYDRYRKERPNKYNPWMYDKEKYPDLYEQEMNNFMAEEAIMADVLFSTEVHEDISRRLASLGTDLMGEGDLGKLFNVKQNGNPIANALGSDLSILADSLLRKSELLNMMSRIEVLKLGTREQKREAGLLQKQMEMLQEWAGLSDTYIRELRSETKASVSPEEQAARRQRTNLYPGTIVRDTETGKEYTVSKHIVGERKSGTVLKDAEGNATRFDANKHVKVKDAPGTPSRFREVEGDGTTFAVEKLYELFDKYVKFVAKTKNGYVFNDQQNEAFAKIKDFIRLSVEERKVVNTINLLSDPNMFDKYFNWQVQIQSLARKKKAMLIENAFEKFKGRAEKNKMLSDLFDLGVFVLPEDVKTLKEFKVPDFYDAVSRDIVEPGSDKYEKAVAILEEYAAKQGKTVVRPEPIVAEEVVEEEQAPVTEKPVVEEERFTVDTSISDLKSKHSSLIPKLLNVYRKWYEKAYETPTTATDDEILNSEDFMEVIFFSSEGSAIVDDYNKGRAPVSKEPETKKQTMKEAPSKLDPISDLVFEEFQLSGRVAPFILEKIAARIIDKTPLSKNEEKIIEAKRDEIEKYKTKIEEERKSAKVPTLITKAMRKELIEDLRYTSEDVDAMKPETATQILKEGIMNPNLSKMEEEASKDDLLARLAKVETAEELARWKEEAAEFRLAPESERKAFEKRHGVVFNGDYIRDLVEYKVQELRDNLDFDSLVPKTSVKLLNGAIMVVKSNNGNTLVLVDPMGYNDPSTPEIPINKDEVKNYIMMKNGEFVDTKEEVELTPEEINEIKEGVKASNEDPTTDIKDAIDASMLTSSDDAKNDLFDSIKECEQ